MFFSSVVMLPIIGATVAAIFPGKRPKRKALFVLVASALAYGAGAIVYVLAVPFSLVDQTYYTYISELGYRGFANFANFANFAGDAVDVLRWLAIATIAICSVAIPVYLRRAVWHKLA